MWVCGLFLEEKKKRNYVKKLCCISFTENKQLNIYKYSKDKHTTDEPNNNQLLNSADLKVKHWHIQEESVKIAEDIAESGRIFVRNLSYTVTEDDLTKLFEKYGKQYPLLWIHKTLDQESRFEIFRRSNI